GELLSEGATGEHQHERTQSQKIAGQRLEDSRKNNMRQSGTEAAKGLRREHRHREIEAAKDDRGASRRQNPRRLVIGEDGNRNDRPKGEKAKSHEAEKGGNDVVPHAAKARPIGNLVPATHRGPDNVEI